MRQLAETVVALCGSRSTIEFKPLPVGDPVRRCPDFGLARQHLRWQPRTGLHKGLQQTIDYFRRVLGQPA